MNTKSISQKFLTLTLITFTNILFADNGAVDPNAAFDVKHYNTTEQSLSYTGAEGYMTDESGSKVNNVIDGFETVQAKSKEDLTVTSVEESQSNTKMTAYRSNGDGTRTEINNEEIKRQADGTKVTLVSADTKKEVTGTVKGVAEGNADTELFSVQAADGTYTNIREANPGYDLVKIELDQEVGLADTFGAKQDGTNQRYASSADVQDLAGGVAGNVAKLKDIYVNAEGEKNLGLVAGGTGQGGAKAGK